MHLQGHVVGGPAAEAWTGKEWDLGLLRAKGLGFRVICRNLLGAGV